MESVNLGGIGTSSGITTRNSTEHSPTSTVTCKGTIFLVTANNQDKYFQGGADGDAVWTAFVVRRRRPILGAQSMPPNGLFDTGE